jgi:hypothetical protein
MEFLVVLTVMFALGFFVGWRAREQTAVNRIKEFEDQLNETMIEEFKSKVIDINVEDHDGVFYVYKKEDGTYLAHGPTMESLEDILTEKFPGKMFNATPDDLERLKTR